MTDDEDDSTGVNFSQPNYMEEHYNCMTLREQLQEFPGRVPQRKRKATATILGNPQQQQQQQLNGELHVNKPKVRKIYTHRDVVKVKDDEEAAKSFSLSRNLCKKK
jgi:hypothetical protein